MSVTALPVKEPVVDSADEDGLDHIVCCDPNKALCGLDVTYVDWVENPAEEDECLVCLDLWSLPKATCGGPFCRLRQRWRDRRWFK